jgi:hypothetical protein
MKRNATVEKVKWVKMKQLTKRYPLQPNPTGSEDTRSTISCRSLVVNHRWTHMLSGSVFIAGLLSPCSLLRLGGMAVPQNQVLDGLRSIQQLSPLKEA